VIDKASGRRPKVSRGAAGVRFGALAALPILAALGCGPSAAELGLRQRQRDLTLELAEITQYNTDLKQRMQLVEARNRVLWDLVQGLTHDADSPTPQKTGALTNAGTSLKSLDRDLEQLIANVEHSHEQMEALRVQRSSLEGELSQARRALEASSAIEQSVAARRAGLKRLVAPIAPLVAAGQLDLRVTPGRLALLLPEDVLFPHGAVLLSGGGKALLDRVGEALATLSDRHFEIVTATDLLPERQAAPSSARQSAARAVEVLRYLVQHGVPTQHLSVSTRAATQPDPDEISVQRKLAISLLPQADELPDWPTRQELLEVEPQPTAAAGLQTEAVSAPETATSPPADSSVTAVPEPAPATSGSGSR
jgi:flagellar motor protein MotB